MHRSKKQESIQYSQNCILRRKKINRPTRRAFIIGFQKDYIQCVSTKYLVSGHYILLDFHVKVPPVGRQTSIHGKADLQYYKVSYSVPTT